MGLTFFLRSGAREAWASLCCPFRLIGLDACRKTSRRQFQVSSSPVLARLITKSPELGQEDIPEEHTELGSLSKWNRDALDGYQLVQAHRKVMSNRIEGVKAGHRLGE